MLDLNSFLRLLDDMLDDATAKTQKDFLHNFLHNDITYYPSVNFKRINASAQWKCCGGMWRPVTVYGVFSLICHLSV